MLERNGTLVRQIEQTLLEEIKLQVGYSSLLEEESSLITKFKSENVGTLTQKREELYKLIAQAKARREDLTQKIPGADSGKGLRDLLRAQAHRDDARRLVQHAEKLKTLVQSNQTRGREFGRLVHFALTIVNGSLSILWSATQSITRAYGRNGVVKEKFTPKSREQMTIEEA